MRWCTSPRRSPGTSTAAQVDAVHDQIVGHQRAVLAFLGKHLVSSDSRSRLALLGYTGWRLAKPGVRLLRRAPCGRDPLPASVLAPHVVELLGRAARVPAGAAARAPAARGEAVR